MYAGVHMCLFTESISEIREKQALVTPDSLNFFLLIHYSRSLCSVT